MSPKTTHLKPSSSPLPTITPHLMPFHVAHTCSAPLSTYFIVKPAQQPDTVLSDGPSLVQRVKARFMSAFRGRKIQGVSVDLPSGYSGIILKTEESLSGKEANGMPRKRLAPAKNEERKGRRAIRKSTRGNLQDMDGDGPMEEATLEEDGEVIQTLCPIAKFSNFTLWNADVDADEGQDEYLRALSEYQQLLTEIHQINP